MKTGLGVRRLDILAERNGQLVHFEVKKGRSRYLPSQRAKDHMMARAGVRLETDGPIVRIPTVVIRGK